MLSNHIAAVAVAAEPVSGLERIADVPIYFADAVVRRAESLQKMADSAAPKAHLSTALAQQLGLCAIGRATNRRFLCYSAPERLQLQPELAEPAALPGSGQPRTGMA